MSVKLLGFLDLLIALIFILAQWDIGVKFAVFCAIYLILKGIVFIYDIASIVDMIAGVYLILVLLNIHSAFSFIFILWLIQKGLFSLAS